MGIEMSFSPLNLRETKEVGLPGRVERVMIIPDHLVRGLNGSTRPVVLFRNEHGNVIYGFVLRPDEFVTSMHQMNEALKLAGLPPVDAGVNLL